MLSFDFALKLSIFKDFLLNGMPRNKFNHFFPVLFLTQFENEYSRHSLRLTFNAGVSKINATYSSVFHSDSDVS